MRATPGGRMISLVQRRGAGLCILTCERGYARHVPDLSQAVFCTDIPMSVFCADTKLTYVSRVSPAEKGAIVKTCLWSSST